MVKKKTRSGDRDNCQSVILSGNRKMPATQLGQSEEEEWEGMREEWARSHRAF